MRMHDNGSTESGVENGVDGAGDERSESQWHQTGGKQPVKGPVVRAVGWRRRRHGSGIVD